MGQSKLSGCHTFEVLEHSPPKKQNLEADRFHPHKSHYTNTLPPLPSYAIETSFKVRYSRGMMEEEVSDPRRREPLGPQLSGFS